MPERSAPDAANPRTRIPAQPVYSRLTPREIQADLLLRRAGFGGSPLDVQRVAAQGLHASVNALVDYESTPDTFTPPPDAILSYKQQGGLAQQLNQLTFWWLNQMLGSTRPLQEKMTLFWHGHFATGFQKVRSTRLMYQQNQTFRQNALGRFDDLLTAMYKDPAMLVWLDGERNTRAAPNENWGREVMELFCLGRGNYTEADVHACARAFTGWRLDENGVAVFVPRLFDTGIKTLLGQTGAWNADDAVRILAASPHTGPFLATKLWRFFASDQPSSSTIQQLASVYYATNHSLREVVRTMFALPEFYSDSVRYGHMKSPVEFVLTPLHQLGLSAPDLTLLPRVLALQGQELFNPSNVGGWPGGPTWINATSMLGRFNLASMLTGDASSTKTAIDVQAFLDSSGVDPTGGPHNRPQLVAHDLVVAVADRLGIALTPPTRDSLLQYIGDTLLDDAELNSKVRGLIHLALVSPEYQAS